MTWLAELKHYLEEYNLSYVEKDNGSNSLLNADFKEAFRRGQEGLQKRKAEVIKSNLKAKILKHHHVFGKRDVEYLLYKTNFIRQKNHFYIEEFQEVRNAIFDGDQLVSDHPILDEKEKFSKQVKPPNSTRDLDEEVGYRYTYNRLEAVRYAERWWNEQNPQYKGFEDDCTNFISQCLHAGGAPMRGYPNRSNGWWMQNNSWSYSWTVANALRWYLSGSKKGLRAREVESADQLSLGDVICYDFDGDGKWQHTTIVVAKDEQGMPLVNAHTTNSRMRYWEYQDSTAWTPNIQYKFFHIIDD